MRSFCATLYKAIHLCGCCVSMFTKFNLVLLSMFCNSFVYCVCAVVGVVVITNVAKIVCGLGRLTVVVVEFADYGPVLYGARPVGWTSLYATRVVVCLSPPLDTGWFYVPMVRQWLWVCPVVSESICEHGRLSVVIRCSATVCGILLKLA